MLSHRHVCQVQSSPVSTSMKQRVRATRAWRRTQEEDLPVAVAEEAGVYLARVLHTINAYQIALTPQNVPCPGGAKRAEVSQCGERW